MVVDRFERSFYGEMTDALNRGDRSDRFMVRWDVLEPPGNRRAAPPDGPALVRRVEGERPERGADLVEDLGIIEIPADHAAIRRADPSLAGAWRDVVAEAAESCLGRGLLGVAFDRERSAYVFARTTATIRRRGRPT